QGISRKFISTPAEVLTHSSALGAEEGKRRFVASVYSGPRRQRGLESEKRRFDPRILGLSAGNAIATNNCDFATTLTRPDRTHTQIRSDKIDEVPVEVVEFERTDGAVFELSFANGDPSVLVRIQLICPVGGKLITD